MNAPLRILLIEDSALDADLIELTLKSYGLSFQLAQIQSEPQLRGELTARPPDLILSDHGLPSFDGFRALDIVRELRPELPFIFVSGSNDQGMVAKMYEQGATDYVFKRDLVDLVTAVRSALDLDEAVTESGTFQPQPELKLKLPPASSSRPAFAPPLGRLLFCPKCRSAQDEAGLPVDLERYLGDRIETVICRETCMACRETQPKPEKAQGKRS